MSTTTIHSSTSHGTHRGAPDGDASENIQALREAFRGVADYQQVAETAQAEAIGLRQRIRDLEDERDHARRLAATYRAQLTQQQLADRLRSIEADLLAENRLLRDQIEDLTRLLESAGINPRRRGWWQP